MPNLPHGFKRLVLALQTAAPDRGLQVVAELADLLQVELLGLCLEDSGLRDLAGLPFAKEFRGLSAGWQPIDLKRLSRDLDLAARGLERMFDAAVRELSTTARFEVLRGRLTESIAAISRSGDILVIMEPVSPAERATSQFTWLSEAAFSSAAAVLLVPQRIVRSRGPIVAIAAMPDDPSIHAGAAFAVAAKEELVIIDANHHQVSIDAPRLSGREVRLKVEQLTAAKTAFPDPAACTQAFGHLQERLIVMTRGAFDDSAASIIASARQVPVLVIEPPISEGARTESAVA